MSVGHDHMTSQLSPNNSINSHETLSYAWLFITHKYPTDQSKSSISESVQRQSN